MTAILTPSLALRHLRELSTDLRAALALAPDGRLLAGDTAIEAPARALLTALGARGNAAVRTDRGTVLVARTPSVALVVVAGPHVLAALLEHDLRTLLTDVHGAPEAGSGPFGPPPAGAGPVVETLISAADAVFAG